MGDAGGEGQVEFDFDTHRARAVEGYLGRYGLYEDFALALEGIISAALESAGLLVHTLEVRAKDPESFGRKAARRSAEDPEQPKYTDPLTQITDLAGGRVIAFFLRDVDAIAPIIRGEFEVLEEIDKSAEREAEGTFVGYQSIHFIVRLKDTRTGLPEYARFEGLVAEVQARTILQHAWAEIEHDMQYKAVDAIPAAIRRRFASLAGMIAVADREFQAIQEEASLLRERARESVEAGRLDEVEITADALKAYLDRRLGPDGRMADYSYSWLARALIRLGFKSFDQVDAVVEGIDDAELSRRVWGGRQGQITRFEDMLYVAMGDAVVKVLPYLSWRAKPYEDAGIVPENREIPVTDVS
jgi:ppGpp synthetase/RelA/SpoT-type nucleotidyltranferase